MFDTSATPTIFRLGGDLKINRLGYGAMRLTGQPGNFGPYHDWSGGVSLLRRALELGVNFFDSAWAYGPETADQIVGEALDGQNAVIATKGGVGRLVFLTWLGVYPVLTAIASVLEPILSPLDVWTQTFVMSAVMVPIMVVGVMPALKRWL